MSKNSNAYVVCGFRPFDFTDDTGKNIKGYTLHILQTINNLYGFKTDKFSVSRDLLTEADFKSMTDVFASGSYPVVDLLFNRWGRISSLSYLGSVPSPLSPIDEYI